MFICEITNHYLTKEEIAAELFIRMQVERFRTGYDILEGAESRAQKAIASAKVFTKQIETEVKK